MINRMITMHHNHVILIGTVRKMSRKKFYLVTVQLTTFVKLLTDLYYLHMYPMAQLAELRPEAEGPVGRGLNMLA